MDPAHRDRIAFARVCSGTFERGMEAVCACTGKLVSTKYATTVFGAQRDTVDVAYPGDVVGLVNATRIRLGDTLYAGDPVEYAPMPRFVPEVFATARPIDSGRTKQFRRGLAELDEEGVVQVLRDPDGAATDMVLAAVGQLQFDVLAHRLATEFNAPAELLSTPYSSIVGTDDVTADRLRTMTGIRILSREDGELVALFENPYRLNRLRADHPELELRPLLTTTPGADR